MLICPFCERPIFGKSVPFGNRQLHPACHAEMNEEMDAILGEADDFELINQEQEFEACQQA